MRGFPNQRFWTLYYLEHVIVLLHTSQGSAVVLTTCYFDSGPLSCCAEDQHTFGCV